MPRRRSPTPSADYVPHPRYGAQPIPSGYKVPEEDVRRGHWRLSNERIFLETAIPANVARQNYVLYPRAYYVDVVRRCRTCDRQFLFFAKEQQYWFEKLHIFVDADCVHCAPCRRAARVQHRRLERYSGVAAKPAPTRKELMVLVDDAIWLVEHGVLKNLDNVRAVKNRALKAIAEHPPLQTLIDTLARAQAEKTT